MASTLRFAYNICWTSYLIITRLCDFLNLSIATDIGILQKVENVLFRTQVLRLKKETAQHHLKHHSTYRIVASSNVHY